MFGARLEPWATARLEALGVDGVFAPYVVGMLDADGGGAGDLGSDVEEVKFNIHQVLMGWLSPEDEERAQEFVDDLVKYATNPALVPEAPRRRADDELDVIAAAFERARLADINDVLSGDGELKASAPTFVPGTLKFVPPALADDDTGEDEDEEDADDGLAAYGGTRRTSLNPHPKEFVPGGGNIPKSPPPLPTSDADPDVPVSDDEQEDEDEVDGAVEADGEQDEDSFFWSVAYDLVGHLQLKFPDIDPTRLCDLLRLVGLDADKAHAVLKATLERESIGPGQVCRHYLQGECRRADCMFLHDTETITCRFWLRGSCMQNEQCVFAHDFTEYYALDDASLARRDYDSEDEEDDSAHLDFQAEDMFPSLQGAGANSSSPAQANASSSDLSMNFARAVSLPTPPGPSSMTAGFTAGSGGYGLYGSLPSRTPAPPPPLPSARALYRRSSANGAQINKWVSTGDSVAAQYLELREQAYQMACARNKCFMGATQAYRNGNKALAKSLSTQGHDYNAKMKEYHYLAASEIFDSRNPPNQIYMERLMDLHGLHVAEAVELLAHMLPKLAGEGLDSMYLVTGSGHHSKGPLGNARLLPAVEQFLGTEGYRYSGVADGRGFVGMLLVDLQW